MDKDWFDIISSKESFKNFLKEAHRESLEEFQSKVEPSKQKAYMTLAVVSKYIHLSEPALYKRVANNTIPHRHMGRKIVFFKDEIDAWVESNCK